MTKPVKNSRRDLRERVFQALMSLEFGGDQLTASHFAYTHDAKDDQAEDINLPIYLLSMVQGVVANKDQLDAQLASKLKSGWTMERLTSIDRTLLRMGLYEMLYFEDTPARVALNEVIELAKTFSDPTSAKFVNGLLRQFMTEED
jgi:N utilization substance protein B